MTILSNLYKIFNSKILINISDKYKKRFKFGFECLSLKPLISLNANARILLKNRKTAETKIYRVVHTKIFINYFLNILSTLNIVKNNDKIIIDFSTFNTRQVLMFAKQTENGRAIPLYFNFIKYPIKKGSQNLFIIEEINKFLKTIGHKKVLLIFDRGFACPSIIKYLCKIKQKFIIRIKKKKHVRLKSGNLKSVEELHFKDSKAHAYQNDLRFIRSNEKGNNKENWYLVTNDSRRKQNTILKLYYHGFEIEELFKDLKRLNNLEYFRNISDSTFQIVLWFSILGHWLIWFSNELYLEWLLFTKHAKHKLCYLRFCLEKIQQEINNTVLAYLTNTS